MGGFDLKVAIDSVAAFARGNGPVVLSMLVGLWLFSRTRFYKRLAVVLEDLFFTNWRLGLLAATGIILSAASGWTTWDGMRNFTGEPILSGMVTFGIQGVMLIVAWLIGESFATGMNVRSDKSGGTDQGLMWAVGFGFLGIFMLGIGAVAHYSQSTSYQYAYGAGLAALLVGLFTIAARTDTLGGYVDAMRVMVKSAVLWVMFLACMATSVFFSFDSLFSTIFPQEERKRAAELRAQNQVAGIVSDIGNLIQRRQLSEAEGLFGLKGWQEYERDSLQRLATAAAGSQREIEAFFSAQMEQRRAAVAEQQGRIATSQASQAGLSGKRNSLTDELARLKSERPGLVEEVAQKREVVETTTKDVDAKRVEVLAEEKGVEGTGKIGRGQMFRQRKAEEDSLREKLKIAEERLREPQRRLTQTDQRLVQIERELSGINGDLSKLQGEAQTAESRIKLAEEAKSADEGALKTDPARMLPAFEKARQEFRQSPRAEGLAEIQRQCNGLLGAMNATPATKSKVAGIDCDPKSANEAASRIFALNDGSKAFNAACQGGDKLAQYKTADDLFGFARKCAQDSGLGSKDTDELRQKVNFIELNRDDKANRFVVTWNAFQDGNRLAYLALAIAIAIDSLIFMSGLFAANAVRSPLSDVPSSKARSAEQLEAIIDNSLLPARFENARIVIEAMDADTSRSGYSAVVDMSGLDPDRRAVIGKVLNAGATISAVHRDERHPSRYFVRPELFEYLSIAGNKAFEKHGDMIKEDIQGKLKLDQLEKDISVALLPEPSQSTGNINSDIAQGAQLILDHLHPFPYREGTKKYDENFRTELRMDEFEAEQRKRARRAMTAGYGLDLVRPAVYKVDGVEKEQDGRYVLHTDLVKTLTRLRARMLLSTSSAAQIAAARQGGAMSSATAPQLEQQGMTRQLVDESRNPAKRDTLDDLRAGAQPPFADEAVDQFAATDHADGQLKRELIGLFAEHLQREYQDVEYYVSAYSADLAEQIAQNLDLVLRTLPAQYAGKIRDALEAQKNYAVDAYQSLPSNQLTAPRAPTLASDIKNTLISMSSAMMLAPKAAYRGYLRTMLEDMARSAPLSDEQRSLYNAVVTHLRDLDGITTDANYWEEVVRRLIKFQVRLVQTT